MPRICVLSRSGMDTVQGLMDGALTYAPVRRDGTASETELPEHSEDAIALSFAEQHAENLRFVAVWNGHSPRTDGWRSHIRTCKARWHRLRDRVTGTQ